MGWDMGYGNMRIGIVMVSKAKIPRFGSGMDFCGKWIRGILRMRDDGMGMGLHRG